VSRTAIVTDTTHYLPRELVQKHGIREVSLYVTLEGEQRRESEIDDYGEFYARLAASGESVSTSQPSVGDFVDVYEPLLAQGREIVSIHLAAGISGTYASALQAKEQLERAGKDGERIRVYDSRTAAGGMGIVVLAAANAAGAGLDGEAVLERTRAARDGVQLWFAVETLEYLRRGGRIGAAQAWLGSALRIKPILTFGEQVEPVERVRTWGRAVERLHGYAEQRKAEGADAWVVQHIQAPEQAAQLAAHCRELFGHGPLYISEIGPVLGAHAGPGLLGVGGIAASLVEPPAS